MLFLKYKFSFRKLTFFQLSIPIGEPVAGRGREQHTGSDLPNLQTDMATDDATRQFILYLYLVSVERSAVTSYPDHSPHQCVGTRVVVSRRLFENSSRRPECAGPIGNHWRFRTIVQRSSSRPYQISVPYLLCTTTVPSSSSLTLTLIFCFQHDRIDEEILHDAPLRRRVQTQNHRWPVSRYRNRLCGDLSRGLGQA